MARKVYTSRLKKGVPATTPVMDETDGRAFDTWNAAFENEYLSQRNALSCLMVTNVNQFPNLSAATGAGHSG